MDYPLPNFSTDLGGQVAIVTGASAGLGTRFAKVLAAAGAKVALTARRVDKLEQLAAEIREAGGVAEVFALDVTQPDQLVDIVGRVAERLGTPQILINNAGIPDAARAVRIPVDLIERVIDTNLKAPFILSREVAARLIAEKLPGRIVTISSSSAFHYNGNGAALYSITKAGVVRMVEALAVEWAPFNINVTGIAPGAFESEMMDGMVGRIGSEWIDQLPRKRLGNPAQLDGTLLFLVSPASDAITGTIVRADDGQHPR